MAQEYQNLMDTKLENIGTQTLEKQWYRNRSLSYLITFYSIILLTSCIPKNDNKTITNCTVVDKDHNGRLIYSQVDEMPAFKSKRYVSFMNYLLRNVKFSLDTPLASYRIDVKFDVLDNGKIDNCHVNYKKIKDYSVIDKAVVKALMDMPIWIPGICNKKKVIVRYSFISTIRFEQEM